MPEQPTPPLCSECGRPEDLKAFRRSLRKRRAILGWSIALVALLIGVSAVIARTKTTGVSSGGFFPTLAEPVFTLAQVRAIAEHGADGTHEPGDLVRALQDLPDYAHPMHRACVPSTSSSPPPRELAGAAPAGVGRQPS